MVVTLLTGLGLLHTSSFKTLATPQLQRNFRRNAASSGQELDLTIDGVTRQALVCAPTIPTSNPPVVFCFHGHGGTMRYASRSYDLQKLWPEAVIVYGQGLPTKGGLYDPTGSKNGWDVSPDESNKDLKFVDALYRSVSNTYHFDPKKAFAMGHSNGGFFSYTLWAMRPNLFAGFGVYEGAMLRSNPTTPKPVFITIGDQDKVVPVKLQESSLARVLTLNGNSQSTQPFAGQGKLYGGPVPTVLWSYPGGHTFEKASVPALVQFFKDLASKSL